MIYETQRGQLVAPTLQAARREARRTGAAVRVDLNGFKVSVYPDSDLTRIIDDYYLYEYPSADERATRKRGLGDNIVDALPGVLFLVLAILFMLLILSSCSKTEVVEPRQIVTYQAECTGCLVYIEDAKWNRDATTDRGKNQHFVVTGKFEYKFVNNGLDSVSMRIYTSALGPGTDVSARIFTNDGKSIDFRGRLGFPESYFPGGDIDFEHTLELEL